jgi:hypothetical protein
LRQSQAASDFAKGLNSKFTLIDKGRFQQCLRHRINRAEIRQPYADAMVTVRRTPAGGLVCLALMLALFFLAFRIASVW